MIIALTLLVAIVGLLMLALAKTNADIKRIGEIMFFCGLLAFLLDGAQRLITILGMR